MLHNSMAELGCDRPETILKLHRNLLPAGEMLTGSFLFWRETVEHADRAIDVDFVMRAQLHDEVVEQQIDRFRTQPPQLLEDRMILEFPFAYRLPKWLPVSTHAIRYYLRPQIWPAGPGDEYAGLEAIIVQPNREQAWLMNALSKLGFQEKLDSRYWNGQVQEFDFVAGKGLSKGVQELTVQFHPENDRVHVSLHIDQREPVRFLLTNEQDAAAFLRKSLCLD